MSLPDWVTTGDQQYATTEYRDGALRPVALDKDVKFSDSAVRELARDLLRRYAEAFGGKKKFLEATRGGGLSSSDLTPVIRSEFEKFAKEP